MQFDCVWVPHSIQIHRLADILRNAEVTPEARYGRKRRIEISLALLSLVTLLDISYLYYFAREVASYIFSTKSGADFSLFLLLTKDQ